MQHPSGTADTALVIIFVLLFATFLVNIMAVFSRAGKISLCFYIVAFFLQMCVVVRHVEEWLVNDDENRNRKRLPVHFAQALLYSALQCVIHCYLIVQLWSFPPYVVASFVVSFLSLLWGFALVTPHDYSFEDDENADEPSKPSSFYSICLIIRQVGFLISRLLLLAFFCWSFGPFITLVFAPQIVLGSTLCLWSCSIFPALSFLYSTLQLLLGYEKICLLCLEDNRHSLSVHF